MVQDGKVQIVDEFTGRILHGRRYSEGLHQAIEAKERIKIAQRNRTLATITFQNYFRMYGKLAGMTGTADTEAQEFSRIYTLDVVVIPTNRPVDREDNDDVIYLTEDDKLAAICDEIAELHAKGQPVLVGTISIEKSERLSRMLVGRGRPPRGAEREEPRPRGPHHRGGGSEGLRDDRHEHGGPRHRHQARRQPRVPGPQASGLRGLRRGLPDRPRARVPRTGRRDYEEVKSLGGLHVLGTERHEARRIDNQLRGRSGRQGDPGSSRFYISLDDDLMRLFGGENIKSLMSRLGMKKGEPIVHPWLNKSIERAQKKVEERNFEIRKHLLEYDDVLNEQRKFIYAARDEIIGDPDLKERLLATAEEVVDDLFSAYRETVVKGRGNLPGLLSGLKEKLWFEPDESPEALAALDPEALEDAIKAGLRRNLQGKAGQLGPGSSTASS